ncbi:hypothetical protein DFH06DRAFT_482415 [Mycena polygramma]|nr:hypothetical protein DFH06DRAFT_482415 [Mycena polygramma]
MAPETSSDVFIFEPIRDSSYYLETVVFKVENTLFKVPRFQFERHSGVFADTFSLPQPAEGAEGSDDKVPFKLDGIKRADFEALLKVIYPMTAVPKTPDLKEDEWISVLTLSTQWDFIEVRDLAILRLTVYAQNLGPAERIMLARKFDVSSWLRSGYTDLARRKMAITSEEAAKIGWEETLQICQLREAAIAPIGRAQNPFEFVSLGDAFQAEFKRVDSAHEPLPPVPRIRSAKSPPLTGNAAPALPLTAAKRVRIDPAPQPPLLTPLPTPSSDFKFDRTSGFTFKSSTSSTFGTSTATTSTSNPFAIPPSGGSGTSKAPGLYNKLAAVLNGRDTLSTSTARRAPAVAAGTSDTPAGVPPSIPST